MNPAWSGNGLKLAFSSTRDGAPGIYVTDFLAGTTVKLTGAAGFDDTRPTWSPDGTKIAFERLDAATATTEVWIAASDGLTAPTNFTNSSATTARPAVAGWDEDRLLHGWMLTSRSLSPTPTARARPRT